MKTNEIVSAGVNGISYIFAFAQTNQVFQTIELVLAILTSLVLLAYRIWRWWKDANADGKIDKEEIKDGVDIMKNGIEGVKEVLDKHENSQEGEEKDGHENK